MRYLTDRTFSDFIAAGKKYVVCTAGYCKLCRGALNKAELLTQSENIAILCLTAPTCIATMSRLRVKKVPTVITYEDGKELERAVGTTALLNAIDQACKS